MNVREIPILPLRGILVFPYMVIHLDVGRERSMAAIEEAMLNDRRILLLSQKDAEIDSPVFDDLYTVGTIAEIKQLLRLPGGTLRVLVEGLHRGEIEEFLAEEPYFKARVIEIADKQRLTPEIENMIRSLIHQFEEYARLSKKISPEAVGTVLSVKEPGRAADLIASHLSKNRG